MAGPVWMLGIVAIVLGLSKIHAVRAGYDFSGSSRMMWAVGFILVLWTVGYAFGVPGEPVRGRLLTAALAAGGAVLAVSVAQLFIGDALLPRLVVFGTGLCAIPWGVVCERLAVRGAQGEAILVVGNLDDEQELRADLREHAERSAVLAGLCPTDAARPTPDDPAPVVSCARRAGATMLVLTRDAQEEDLIITQAAVLHEAGLRVRTLLAFSEDWLGKLPVADLERISVLFDIGEIHGTAYSRVKRMVDVAMAVVGTLTLALVFPVVLVGDLVANRGRVLYRQPRVGRYGREFNILKFRTMRESPEATTWTEERDTRVTGFGRLLRTTHLDELPQVLNVLRGDLAIVGPRPEQPRYVSELREKIPFYDVRHLVRPGITGWAQVKYHYGADELDALEKLQYEMWYLRHQSLLVDARIALRTVRHVVGTSGR